LCSFSFFKKRFSKPQFLWQFFFQLARRLPFLNIKKLYITAPPYGVFSHKILKPLNCSLMRIILKKRTSSTFTTSVKQWASLSSVSVGYSQRLFFSALSGCYKKKYQRKLSQYKMTIFQRRCTSKIFLLSQLKQQCLLGSRRIINFNKSKFFAATLLPWFNFVPLFARSALNRCFRRFGNFSTKVQIKKKLQKFRYDTEFLKKYNIFFKYFIALIRFKVSKIPKVFKQFFIKLLHSNKRLFNNNLIPFFNSLSLSSKKLFFNKVPALRTSRNDLAHLPATNKEYSKLKNFFSFTSWKYRIRKIWSWRLARHHKIVAWYLLRNRRSTWGRYPLIRKIQRSARKRTWNRRKILRIDPLAQLFINCKKTITQLSLYLTWYWKKSFRRVASLCTTIRRQQKSRFHQLKVEPKFFVNNTRFHTTMHPNMRGDLPWLETLIFPRSYKSALFYPHMWRRFRRVMLTKRNKLYKSYLFFLHNRWKPSALRVPNGFFRLNHLFKRVIYPFYGRVKHNAFRKLVIKARFKKEKFGGVISKIIARYEQNLSNLVLSLGWAPTLALSDWLIKKGFFSVNGTTCVNPRFPIKQLDLIQQTRPIELLCTLRQNFNQRFEIYYQKNPANVIVSSNLYAAIVCEPFDKRFLQQHTTRTNAFITEWVCGL